MNKINLNNILETLRNPAPDNIVTLDDTVRVKALKSIQNMFDYAESN